VCVCVCVCAFHCRYPESSEDVQYMFFKIDHDEVVDIGGLGTYHISHITYHISHITYHISHTKACACACACALLQFCVRKPHAIYVHTNHRPPSLLPAQTALPLVLLLHTLSVLSIPSLSSLLTFAYLHVCMFACLCVCTFTSQRMRPSPLDCAKSLS
jgi:hypothetical protein